ncbi:MAG: hypothetical protein ACWA5Q_02185 [bacterium]
MDNSEETVEYKQPSKLPWFIMGAVVIVTIIAIWLVPSDDQPAPEDIPMPGQVTPVATEAASGAPGDAARAFIEALMARDGSTQEAFDEAERQAMAGNAADAYLLYFYAGKNGHPAACMVLGEQADPAYFVAGRSLLDQPDNEQAFKWYSEAQKVGAPGAVDRLAALQQAVEALAESGDEQAERLTLQWK